MPINETSLTGDELRKIQLFRERVEDLGRKGLVKAGQTKITVNIVGVVPEVLEGLDEDQFTSFLVTLRQFTLDKDPVHFYSVYNLTYRRCTRLELRDWLVFSRSLWKQTLAMSPLGIEIDGNRPTVDEIFQLFLYGGMVHSDQEKTDMIRNLPPQIQGIMKMMLRSGIGRLYHALVLMEKILWHWLDAPAEKVPLFRDET